MTHPATAWSFSRWDTWRQCPLKYKLQHLDKLDKEQSPAMIRGNAFHVAIAKYIEGKPVPLPAEVRSPYHQALYQFMREFDGMKMVEQQWGFNRNWGRDKWFGESVWLRAVLDVALIYGDGEVEAVDHKTGKRYDKNNDQLELFALTVMFRIPDTKKVKTRLVYVDAGDQEEITEFSAKDRDKLRDKWEKLAAPMMGDRTWPARPNDKCKWCPFRQGAGGQCRFG